MSEKHDIVNVIELDALPAGSVLLAEGSGVWYRAVSGPGAIWRASGSSRHYWAEEVPLPATVLHAPTESGDAS